MGSLRAFQDILMSLSLSEFRLRPEVDGEIGMYSGDKYEVTIK